MFNIAGNKYRLVAKMQSRAEIAGVKTANRHNKNARQTPPTAKPDTLHT